MPELDAFERSLEAAFRSFAERGVAPINTVAFAERVAGQPRARRWPMTAMAAPRLAWVLLAAALLLAALLAAAVVGGWRADHRLAEVRPSPAVVVVAPQVPAATIIADATDILATTQAKPLPVQATCPPGSDPDALGPADQERPSVAWGEAWTGAIAFDRHAGRLVLVADAPDGALSLWTYDVCTNAWQRMSSVWGPPDGVISLVYDADSDRTLAFTDDGRVWSYELATDRWRESTVSIPGEGRNAIFGTKFYHDPSGLVVVYDGTSMWAYDVDTDTLTLIPQQPDPALPSGSGLPDGWIAFGYDPQEDLVVAVVVPYLYDDAANPGQMKTSRKSGDTWTFDPGTGAWRRESATVPSDLIVCGLSSFPKGSTDCWPTNGRAVFDEASGMVVFMNRDWGRPTAPGRVDAFDTRLSAWTTLFYDPNLPGDVREATWCASMPPVYDSLNDRIVCLAKGLGSDVAGVSTFSTVTNQWRWLLEPPPALRPES